MLGVTFGGQIREGGSDWTREETCWEFAESLLCRNMEALRIQNDNLQWELQRLTVENRRLHEEQPEVSQHVDREARLERDVAELLERARESEW